MKKTKAIFYLFLPLVLGSLIGIIIDTKDYYASLVKPSLAPPGWLFPVVWSIIYILMGISFYLYKKKCKTDKDIDSIYYLQLFVNILWSVVFFTFKLKFISVLWILFLLFLVVYMILLFLRKNKISAYLNIPYLLWVIFASYLTIGIYLLN